MKDKYQSAQAEDRTLADKMMTVERYKSYPYLIGLGKGIWEVVIDFMIKKIWHAWANTADPDQTAL